MESLLALQEQFNKTVELEKEKLVKQHREIECERARYEEEKKSWAELEKKLKSSQLLNTIKLNIGGTIFETSLSTLTSVQGTYFTSMFSGKWEPKLEKDGSYFIDRDSTVFRYILNFFRTKKIPLDTLTPQEKFLLFEEAEFFQINPLIYLLKPQNIKFIPTDNYTLSNNNKCATKIGDSFHAILGSFKVSYGHHTWNVNFTSKIISSSKSWMIGIVPSYVDISQIDLYLKCGWYFCFQDLSLYSGPPFNYKSKKYILRPFSNQMTSPIGIKLDCYEKTISYSIHGQDCGVAYKDFSNDFEFQLCVILLNENDTVEFYG